MTKIAESIYNTLIKKSAASASFRFNQCYNDPVNFVDILGLLPGDVFTKQEGETEQDVIDRVAIDFAETYNDDSIRHNREFGSTIFKIEDDNGNDIYSYTVPNRGDELKEIKSLEKAGTRASVKPSEPGTDNATVVAAVHTHGALPKIMKDDPQKQRDALNKYSGIYDASQTDLGYAKGNFDETIVVYTVSAAGTIDKYDANGRSIRVAGDENIIYFDAPKDVDNVLNPNNTKTVGVNYIGEDNEFAEPKGPIKGLLDKFLNSQLSKDGRRKNE